MGQGYCILKIMKHIVGNIPKQFTEPFLCRDKLVGFTYTIWNHDQSLELINPLCMKEIEETIQSYSADKAPGPYVYPMLVIKKDRDFVKRTSLIC